MHIKIGDIIVYQTLSPSDALIDEFMEQYDQAFVLSVEKETREGFCACLALNSGPKHDELAGRLGPFFESLVVVKNAQGHFLGGINMLGYTAPGAGDGGQDVHGLALNYIFIHPDFRRRGLLSRLIGVARHLAGEALGTTKEEIMVFLEMNNPTQMDPDDIDLDSKMSGISQDARLLAWERVGARVIDTKYIQPALSEDNQDSEAGLLLAIITPRPMDTLPAKILLAHLSRFFEISVLKGQPMPDIALTQIQDCAHRECGRYALLAPTSFSLPG